MGPVFHRRAVLAMALPTPITGAAQAAASGPDAARASDPPTAPLGVFEMRHYVTQPGRRDELVSMFEAHFLDAYEAAGATVIATCRNLDAADRWWWIRAFPSLAARESALAGFYGGAVWRARAKACNATLADVGDARLLRPLRGDVLARPPARPRAGAAPPRAVIEARIIEVESGRLEDFARFHAAETVPVLRSLGAEPMAALASLPDPPRDARRPLREGHFFVTLTRFDNASRHRQHVAARQASAAWRDMEAEIARRRSGPDEVLRLAPTARSALR